MSYNNESTLTDMIFWNDDWNNINNIKYERPVFEQDCCKNCPNNPKNNPNASGICHCALPAMQNIRY